MLYSVYRTGVASYNQSNNGQLTKYIISSNPGGMHKYLNKRTCSGSMQLPQPDVVALGKIADSKFAEST